MVGTTISSQSVKSGQDKHGASCFRSKKSKGHKGKRFHEVSKEYKNETMDNLVDQVQSLFYHDVHFNAVNTRMYTN